MEIMLKPRLAWLLLGILVGFASARSLPAFELPALIPTFPFKDVALQNPAPESPTPTPEPQVPCGDDPAQVPPPPPGGDGVSPNYLHTCGTLIYDSSGQIVQITGVNWFGMETGSYAPGGLGVRNWQSILDQITAMGFNTIRLPFTNEALGPNARPQGINYQLNPDLAGLTPLEIMDRVIAGARERGLKVILDRHRPESWGQSPLWYTSKVSEEQWIADWRMLARRYLGNDTVIGVDLHNEPGANATWGTGDPSTDWKMAAEKAGNAVLEENPYLLILVQGIYQYNGGYWFGGNLKGVRFRPVSLNTPNRLVYAPHDFGPGVWPQPWFSDPSFPNNLESVWDEHWGFIKREGIAPVIVGETGGRSVGADKEGTYQRAILGYLKTNDIGYIYWALNPESGDSGGLLAEDWKSPIAGKLELVQTYQAPLIGKARPALQAGMQDAGGALDPKPASTPRSGDGE